MDDGGGWILVGKRRKRPSSKWNQNHPAQGSTQQLGTQNPHSSSRNCFSVVALSSADKDADTQIQANAEVEIEVSVQSIYGRGKERRNYQKKAKHGKGGSQNDYERLLAQLDQAKRFVSESSFYSAFLEQLRSLDVAAHLACKGRIHHSTAESLKQQDMEEDGGLKRSSHLFCKLEGDRLHEENVPDGAVSSGEKLLLHERCKLQSASVPCEPGMPEEKDMEVVRDCTEDIGMSSSVDNDAKITGKQMQHTGEVVVEGNACSGSLRKADGEQQEGLTLVVYGVGSVADSEVSRCQMALASLLALELKVPEGGIHVFDPVLTGAECEALAAMGVSTIPHNEEAGRIATGPTVFYMPHCEAHLYDNVLVANRSGGKLCQVAILGNSFADYQERWATPPAPSSKRPDYLLEIQTTVDERPVSDMRFPVISAFNHMSWHFFPS